MVTRGVLGPAGGHGAPPSRTAGSTPGDVGKRDADGWFFIVDRIKDMINVSGYKVWPRDVEDVLYQHPAVREASVVGVPDDYRGESVRAYVALKAGSAATPDDLVAHCRALLAVYKAPREVVLVDEIPKTPTGKALRRELRERARLENPTTAPALRALDAARRTR